MFFVLDYVSCRSGALGIIYYLGRDYRMGENKGYAATPHCCSRWRMLILIGTVGAIVVWILRRHIPEGPRWLARHGGGDEADRIVVGIERKVVAERGGAALPAPKEVEPEKEGGGSLGEIFRPPYLRRTVILSILNMARVIGFCGFAGLAVFVGVAMLVGILMILMGPGTRGRILECISR